MLERAIVRAGVDEAGEIGPVFESAAAYLALLAEPTCLFASYMRFARGQH